MSIIQLFKIGNIIPNAIKSNKNIIEEINKESVIVSWIIPNFVDPIDLNIPALISFFLVLAKHKFIIIRIAIVNKAHMIIVITFPVVPSLKLVKVSYE